MEKFGVGIVGTGWVAEQHIAAFQSNPYTNVVGLSSSSQENAEAKRKSWGLADAVAYPDYDKLLADSNVHIVSVATPNHLHAEQTIRAAQAGKHILIEKPPALNLKDLRAVRRAVHKAGVKTVVSFVLRWNPLVQTMKEYNSKGKLGKIFYAQVDYWHTSGRGSIPDHWTTRRSTGGSAFLTGGNHAVDAMRWLVDADIVEVSAVGTQINPNYEYPPTMLAWVKFDNGAIGKLSAILEARIPYQFNIDLLGERGTFRDQHIWAPEEFIGQNDWIEIPTITPNSGDVTHHPFKDEVAHFVDCIRNDRESFVNLDDAAKTIEVCLAIDRSAAEGKTVRLPLGAE
jgi:predicted dehydrogenase